MTSQTSSPDLGLHHLGEALLSELLTCLLLEGRLAELPVHAVFPRQCALQFGEVCQDVHGVESIVANCPVSAAGSVLDGMHRIDCALLSASAVIALELKLGFQRLTPRTFSARFSSMRTTHANTRMGGSMVALLDRNGNPANGESVTLRVGDLTVGQKWLLVLRQKVWEQWCKGRQLVNGELRLRQLAGVIVLEDVFDAVGRESAKEIAMGLVSRSVDQWFSG